MVNKVSPKVASATVRRTSAKNMAFRGNFLMVKAPALAAQAKTPAKAASKLNVQG